MKQACVYTHTNTLNGEIFYIGKSNDKNVRPYQRNHKSRNSKWVDYVETHMKGDASLIKVDIIEVETEGDALNIEWSMIKECNPPCNSQYLPVTAVEKCRGMNDLLGSDAIQYMTTEMVEMKSFVARGNSIRLSKGKDVYNAAKYLNGDDMNEFIDALIRKYGGTRDAYIRVDGKGPKARTIADIRIAVKLAMKMDSDFELEVIDSFIGLADWRLKGGDEFKLLNQAIDRYLPGREGKASNQGCYINIAKVIRRRCDATPIRATDTTWNQESADKHAQSMRYEMQHKLVNLLELGLVRDWEHLKELVERV